MVRGCLLVVMALFSMSCKEYEREFQENVQVQFSYCRSDANVALGLTIRNNGDRSIQSIADLIFLVNGKVHKRPFFHFGRFFLMKAMHPGKPKTLFDYTTVQNIGEYLGPGRHSLSWKYGPVLSNEMILEVTNDMQIKEIVVECDDRIRKAGIAIFQWREHEKRNAKGDTGLDK